MKKSTFKKVAVAALAIPMILGATNIANATEENKVEEIVTVENKNDKADVANQNKEVDVNKENSSTKEHEEAVKAEDEYAKAYEDYYLNNDKKDEAGDKGKEDTKPSTPSTGKEDNKKPLTPENPKVVEDNAENGFASEQSATKAAKEALKNDPINKSFSISKAKNGRFFYVLTAAEDLSNVKAPKEEKEVKKPAAKVDEKADEKSFNFDNGFEKKEDAIKQAEALVKNSKINKGYNVTQGADGRYYIQLTPEETKTEGVERKPIEDKKDGKLAKVKDNAVSKDGKGSSVTPANKAGSNVQTGVAGVTGVLGVLSSAAVALFKSKRK